MRFDGKTAIVTGASCGIGKARALAAGETSSDLTISFLDPHSMITKVFELLWWFSAIGIPTRVL
jgi:hypothetical protein